MILACGVCTHWILWTIFPPATPWALITAGWFLGLAFLARAFRLRLAGVPHWALAVVVVLLAYVVASVPIGPLVALPLALCCLLATENLFTLAAPRTRLRRSAILLTAGTLLALAVSGYRSYAYASSLSPAAKTLLVGNSPAWSIELRRIPKGDCATLRQVAAGHPSMSLERAVDRRLAAECGP